MAYKNTDYRPHKKDREILDAAWAMIQSVPYPVTTRWVFYQLLQAGYYNDKKDYQRKCVPLLSRARHNQYEGWLPDSLIDDRRGAINRAGGVETAEEWVEYVSGGWRCDFDHFYEQDYYIEVWYEAEAMSRQFEYYTKGITLRPFSGQPSIAYKYAIAKDLEKKYERYKKPIVILYFGDLDRSGFTIPQSASNDIKNWCDVSFEFIRCGLNWGDEVKYHIPENPKKPGYQWEALSDQQAKELICESVDNFIDRSLIERAEEKGKEPAKLFNQFVAKFPEYYFAVKAAK